MNTAPTKLLSWIRPCLIALMVMGQGVAGIWPGADWRVAEINSLATNDSLPEEDEGTSEVVKAVTSVTVRRELHNKDAAHRSQAAFMPVNRACDRDLQSQPFVVRETQLRNGFGGPLVC